MPKPTFMLREADESPEAVARLLNTEAKTVEEIGSWFRKSPPALATLAARGSSDHAVTFFKYLLEIRTGIPVASLGPSVASVYEAPLRLGTAIHFTVSQSGASPDIVAMQRAAKAGGARTVAIVNVADSPVGREADLTIPLGAGPEKSVAATKSFIVSAAALAAIVAAAADDAALSRGVASLPDALGATKQVDTGPAVDAIVDAPSLFACGRGPGLGIAEEAALKAKETAGLHAEAFSAAEVMHGPARLVAEGFPVIAFVQRDAAFDNSIAALRKLEALGAVTVGFSDSPVGKVPVVVPSTGCGLIDPLVSLLSYYRMIESATLRRGLDPDNPRNLRKVTETV